MKPGKILLAPDSFKGTMSSIEICDILVDEIESVFPGCDVVTIPVADGGEGSVDAMLRAAGGEKIDVCVSGPFFEEITCFYGRIPKGRAVVEMAAAAGLPLARGREDPRVTTTYGVGQLISKAAQDGAKEILVGLGGSCTNDGGCGAAAALGVKFYDENGEDFIPTGGTLERIDSVDTHGALWLRENGIRLRAMCDVNTPLYGEEGAAYVFGPQKGATPDMVVSLDRGLRRFGELLEELQPGVSYMRGGGAAGGMGAGMAALLGAELTPGIEGVLDMARFEEKAEGCRLIVTGEGRIDGQSLRGKVIYGVCRRARAMGIPVIALVGDALDEELEGTRAMGLRGVFTINRRAVPYEKARLTSARDLRYTFRSVLELMECL